MTIKTDHRELLEHWGDYRGALLSKKADEDELQLLRRTFFAGAHSLMYEVLKTLELPRGEAQERLQRLDRELSMFRMLAKEGFDRDHPDDVPLETLELSDDDEENTDAKQSNGAEARDRGGD